VILYDAAMKSDGAKPATLEYSSAPNAQRNAPALRLRAAEPIARAPVIILIALLLMTAIWRLVLAMEILAKPTLENNLGAMVQWRQLDIFAGPLALLLLAIASRRWSIAATVLAAGGIVLDALGLLAEQSGVSMGITDGLLRSGIVAIALAAVVIVLRELRMAAKRLEPAPASRTAPTGDAQSGLDLIDLWRLLTVQWVLVWAAAETLLRFRFATVDLAANPDIRLLLFLLPAVGVLPNVILWITLAWAGTLGISGKGAGAGQARGSGRPRAWVVAMIVFNVGAILLVTSPAKAGSAGAVLMAAGLGVYLLGFPRGAWRGLGGAMIVGGIAILAIGAVLLGGSQFYSYATSQAVTEYASTAMRILIFPAFPILWLAGVGICALRRCVPERLQPRQAGVIAAVLLVVAAVGTAIVFFVVAATGPEAGGFQLLSATAILDAAGVGLGALVTLRGLSVSGQPVRG
jgi:hypothetical protein